MFLPTTPYVLPVSNERLFTDTVDWRKSLVWNSHEFVKYDRYLTAGAYYGWNEVPVEVPVV